MLSISGLNTRRVCAPAPELQSSKRSRRSALSTGLVCVDSLADGGGGSLETSRYFGST